MMALTTASIQAAITTIGNKLEVQHEVLTQLDGTMGDGDLGITLLKAFRELQQAAPNLSDDVGQAFAACAKSVAAVSSSSFGTLLATALISAAKSQQGIHQVAWSEVPAMLRAAGEAMSKRGRGNLGDKTVLDTIQASACAAEGLQDQNEILLAMLHATQLTIDEYRDKPSKLGRARIFGDRTIGLDDPGMMAFLIMLEALMENTAGNAGESTLGSRPA